MVSDGATSVPLWAVQLSSRPAGGPYTVTARLGNVSRSLEDVLFGDVWLCSGQSNMVFGVGQVSVMYTRRRQISCKKIGSHGENGFHTLSFADENVNWVCVHHVSTQAPFLSFSQN